MLSTVLGGPRGSPKLLAYGVLPSCEDFFAPASKQQIQEGLNQPAWVSYVMVFKKIKVK